MSSEVNFSLTGDLRADVAKLAKLGIKTADQIRANRRLMIGTEGLTNTGKTEFILSAPGPKILIACDPSFDSTLENPNPPKSRDLDYTWFDIEKIPLKGTVKQDDFVTGFTNYRSRLYELLDMPVFRTIGIDGDSDNWELQVLAEFGRTTQIHPMQYPAVDGARRAMIKRCWDSGKIIIATNKIKDKYENVLTEDGQPKLDDKGKNVQRRVEGEYKRQGFRDQDYLWQLQIRHLYKAAEPQVIKIGPRAGQVIGKSKPQWGIKILKCKANPMLEGDELWGDKCNFRGLVEYVYPHVPVQEWGLE